MRKLNWKVGVWFSYTVERIFDTILLKGVFKNWCLFKRIFFSQMCRRRWSWNARRWARNLSNTSKNVDGYWMPSNSWKKCKDFCAHYVCQPYTAVLYVIPHMKDGVSIPTIDKTVQLDLLFFFFVFKITELIDI